MIIVIILLASMVLSFIAYLGHEFYIPRNWDTGGGDKKLLQENAPWQWKFFEIWRFFVSFFMGGLIGYYFIVVRYAPIFKGETPNGADFILMIIFAICITGWFPYFLKNVTEGINAIITRILK